MTTSPQAEAIRNRGRALAKTLPETMAAVGALSRSVKDGGVLGLKEKEFVALGIAVAVRCEDCIVFHIDALRKAGATRAELADVLAMSIQMGGGPAVMYAGKAIAYWDETAG